MICEYLEANAPPRRVTLSVIGRMLRVEGEGVSRLVPVSAITWPTGRRRLPRVAGLGDGSSLRSDDAAAWDAFARAHGLTAPPSAAGAWWILGVVLVLLAGFAVVGYQWGIPWAARMTLTAVPETLDRAIGDAALASYEGTWLTPSTVPDATQHRIRASFTAAISSLDGSAAAQALRVEFRGGRLGPNAFALPGGQIVVTDELVTLVGAREDVIVGVLGHERGHVRARHGMRMLLQRTYLGVLASVLIGDSRSLLSAAPALLGELAYSRDFEREADAEAVRVLRAASYSPEAMIVFFEKLAEHGTANSQGWGIALASHPADAERIAFFRDAARGR